VGPPALAGTEERFTLEGLKCDVPYYFGIKAADEIPNVSELSNVIEGLIHDVTPPVIAAVQATPAALWPANHKLVAVEVSVSASDNCDSVPYCKIAAVTSSESANGNGDGNTEADIFVTGDLSVDLRAERSGKGVGRIYTIEVQCVDAAGNSAYGETQVSVAHDRGRGN